MAPSPARSAGILIAQQYDWMVKYATALRLGSTDYAEQVIRNRETA
ncbi:hypothetical protein AAHZ94_04765 [Streptomyces sp. HSW2009]